MSTRSWTDWGPLAERYRVTRPRRMLALDGGGIGGLLTLQILDPLEQELRRRQKAGPEFRLCSFFDLIGGTSTGAHHRRGSCEGHVHGGVDDLLSRVWPRGITKRALIARWKSLYANGPLQRKLQDTFGHTTTLEPQHLRSLLVVVTRNATTDSAWPISSNPWAKYNDRARPDCNLLLPLWQIVRASTAAPVYFQPEVVALDENDPNKTFVFVDGGTTVYNNPAFLMYRMVTEPAYRLGWAKGEHALLMVSVGTGSAPTLGQTDENPEQNLAGAAVQTLAALMSQAAFDQDLSCRTIGRCVRVPFSTESWATSLQPTTPDNDFHSQRTSVAGSCMRATTRTSRPRA